MSSIDSNTLQWVKSEIDDTLKQAQTSLEAYVEDTADESQMRFCINYLHQVHGTLQMVELHGAALAIEEMEKLSQAIFTGDVNNKDDAYEILMHGILQVPDYLEHLLAGNPDMPVVLLPLLNDIRAARNEALLSEGALFTPDLTVEAPGIETTSTNNLSDVARKIRHNYHLGLLSWFNNKNPKAGLQKIADVINELKESASSDEARRVFWIANGLVESLKDDGVETSVAVKMLMGHVDRQIKKIIDGGELILDNEPPAELEKNLLYYVATSTTAGSATKEIKEAFNLKEIMPDTQAVEQARADLSAPNAALMETVSSVIIEDINKVKDNLDVYVRADDKDVTVLDDVKASLTQMADTLAMLNLGVQREAVLQQAEVISNIVSDTSPVDDSELMNVAAAMIAVENSLSEVATAKAAASIDVSDEVDASDTAMAQMQGAENQKLMKTVLDEAKVNLSKVKDALTVYSQNNDERDQLKSIPSLLEQIQGSLMILSLSDSANILGLTNNYIQNKLINETIPPSFEDMNNLADAISSLEYYMESMMGSWGQPEAILDVAIQSLQSLGIDTKATADNVEVVDEIPLPEELPIDDELELSSGLELSLDEGDEVLDILSELDLTLDGGDSALEQSEDEFSLDEFSLELTDDTDSSEDEINLDEISLDDISLDGESSAGGLDFEVDNDDAPFSEEALTEVELKPTEIELSNVPVSKPEVKKEPSLLEDTIDDEIIEIFIEEAEEAYETISENLPMWATNPSNTDPLKEIRRAFHTLKGSGRLVGASDLGEFAWAFENMLNRVLDNTIKVTTELLELMDRGNQALPELFELFKSAQKPKQNILSLMEYADAISKGESVNLDADINAIPDADIEDIVELEIESENNLDELTPSISEEDILEFDGESFELTDELETNEIHVAEEDIFDLVEEELIELVDEEPPPVDIDPTLLDIYRKEVVTHTQSLKDYVVDWNIGAIAANHTLLRALHTLTGSSRTTGVQPLALVCSALENYVKHLKDFEIDFPKAALNELENVISLIESTVDCLDKPGAVLPEYEQLLARIGALPKEIKVAVTTPTESVSTAIESSTEDIPLADYDEELLEIFLEEGTEILEESDQVIHNWKDDPSDIKYVEELQRHLHTLKGGARMAGIAELGDLGHSIESLLTAVVDGHMKATKPMLELVQRSQDELVHMLELVQAHKGIPAATDLIVQVDRMLKNRGEDDDLELAIEAPIEEEIEIPQLNDEVIAEEVNPTFASDEISELEQLEAELREEVNTEEITFPEIELSEPFDEIPELNIEVENSSEVELIEEVPDLNIVVEEPKELIIPVEEVASLPAEVKAETNLAVEEQQQDRRQGGRVQAEQVRVRADLLDNLVNFAGEVSIYRSRLEQQTNNFRYNITEFDDTVNRLREQLRQFEIETETQIEYKSEELSSAQENFDPLEMDRFTTMQHLSRAMMESLGDLDSLRGILNNLTRESETLLLQQSRVNTDLQEGLMRTRMIPFSGQASRLRRIVRQTCGELGKHAELHLEGVDSELDRTILERIISPIEHMLRNAIAHGIETPEKRKSAGKDETGNIHFTISNEGSNILINIKDDGAGIDLEAIRNKGISKGLIKENAPVTKEQLLDMIMQSGFSTAESVSQIAGRGVGMDVVNTEIKQLGGIFNIDTEKGKGTSFTVSLPLTLAITRALMVTLGDDTYAIPLLSVEGVERITASKITEIIESDNQTYNWVDEEYKFMHLGTVMGTNEMALADETMQYPLLMVSSGEYKAAILVDSLLGSREIVVKSVGPQLSTLRGISGATVMGDGSVVLIIDLATLIRLAATTETTETVMPLPVVAEKVEHTTPLVMVVDDSITVRKVTTRLLERYEMRVVAAKDGVDALAQLQEIVPDIMLLDVEMPRMDGFELATNMRNDDRLKDIPIIMITSRTGQKHRDRAASIGVNIYMGKPFTETDLMDNINVLTGKDY